MKIELPRNKYNVSMIYITTFVLIFKPVFPQYLSFAIIPLAFFSILTLNATKGINLYVITYFLFVLFNSFSLLLTNSFAVFSTLLNTFLFILTYSILISKPEHIRQSIRALSFFGIAQAFLLLLRFKDQLGQGRFGNYLIGTDFSNAIGLSYFLIISCIATISYIVISKNKILKVVLISGLIPILLLILFSGTKKAIFTPIVFLFILLFFHNKNKLWKFVLFTSVFIFVIFFIWNYIKDIEILHRYFTSRIESFFSMLFGNDVDSSTKSRLLYIPIAFNTFLNSPLWGLGGIGYSIKYFLKEINVNHPHNTYLELLAANGIGGFILYFYPIILTLKKTFKIKYKTDIKYILIASVLALLFNELNSQSYNIPILNIFFVIAFKYSLICSPDKVYTQNNFQQLSSQNNDYV